MQNYVVYNGNDPVFISVCEHVIFSKVQNYVVYDGVFLFSLRNTEGVRSTEHSLYSSDGCESYLASRPAPLTEHSIDEL